MDSPMISLSPNNQSKPVYCTPNPVPNIPENNQVSLIDYRCAKIAAFTVEGRQLICLPQAFELFLKHLVGGLHTVYTKLKRLEITPVVCNVEQVRILRGLGAIQPGVNRCKLIAPKEFDILFEDCTNSSARPGRPSKRASLMPNDINISETMKRAHYDFVNDCVKSNDNLGTSFRLPYDDDKRFYLRNAIPQSGICPINPANFGFNSILPFGMSSYMMGLFPNNQALIKQLSNLPTISRMSNKEPSMLSKTTHSRMNNSFLNTSFIKYPNDVNQTHLFSPSTSHKSSNENIFCNNKTSEGFDNSFPMKNFEDGEFSTIFSSASTLNNIKSEQKEIPLINIKPKKTIFSIDSLVEEIHERPTNFSSPLKDDYSASIYGETIETDKCNFINNKERDIIRILMQNQMKTINDERSLHNFYEPLREFWLANSNGKSNHLQESVDWPILQEKNGKT
uniref:Dach n=1 Tax=Dendrocoelum lacteum TaxID=27895 RepID=T1DBP2_9PLAT